MANTPVRQYIGARYVPLFANPIQWDNTKTYEPLTIVTNQGNSYTSRQFVPTGIDINNTDYWALTGNYNAQIEQYRQEVAQYDDRINNAQELATTNEQDIATLESYFNALNINNVETAQNVNNYLKTEAIFIGDSWTNGQGATTNENRYSTIISKKLGLNEHNYSVRGIGYIHEINGQTIADLANQAINDNTYQHNKVAFIFIMAGYNDIYYKETGTNNLYNYINPIINNLNNAFPNTRIILANINYMAGLYTQPDIAIAARSIEANTTNAELIFTPCLPFYVLTDQYYADANHPNDNGHLTLANYLIQCITGSPSLVRENSLLPSDAGFASESKYIQIATQNSLTTEIQLTHTQNDPAPTLLGKNQYELMRLNLNTLTDKNAKIVPFQNYTPAIFEYNGSKPGAIRWVTDTNTQEQILVLRTSENITGPIRQLYAKTTENVNRMTIAPNL